MGEDPRFAKGVGHGKPRVRACNRGLRQLKLKAFCLFSFEVGLQVKDLSDSSPLYLRQTAYRSHDQPLLLVSGGRPRRLPMPGSAPGRPTSFLSECHKSECSSFCCSLG